MDALTALAQAGAERRARVEAAEAARLALRAAIRAARAEGHSEYEIARVGECDRMTVRRALGKQ